MCAYVCCRIRAPALLTQCRDLNFLRMFKVYQFCIIFFFNFFKISLNLAVNKKIGFSAGTHLKAEIWPKSIFFFFFDMLESYFYRLVLKRVNSKNFEAFKYRAKNAKSSFIIVPSHNQTHMIKKSSALQKYIIWLPFGQKHTRLYIQTCPRVNTYWSDCDWKVKASVKLLFRC